MAKASQHMEYLEEFVIKNVPKIRGLASVREEVMEDQTKRRTDPDYFFGWRWWINRLNDIVGPIQPGWSIGVSAKAKAGKTSMLVSEAISLARQGAKVLWIGLEEGENETFIRMASNVSGVSRKKFRGETGMSDSDWYELVGGIAALDDLDVVFATAYTMLEVAAVVAEADVDVVMIDYLQLMEADVKSDSRSLEISTISRGLKQLARGNDNSRSRVVFANIQLNDDGKTLWSRDPARDDDLLLAITEVSDVAGNVIPNRISLRVVVSRHSGAGDTIDCYMNGARSLVAELTDVVVVNLQDMVDAALDAQAAV